MTRPLEEGCYGEVTNGSSTVEVCTTDFTYEMYAGEKRLLLPMARVGDIPTIPGELFAKFQTDFTRTPQMRLSRRWELSKERWRPL